MTIRFVLLAISIEFFLLACGRQIFQEGKDIGPSEYMVENVAIDEGVADERKRISFSITFQLDSAKGGDICVAIFDDPVEYTKAEETNYKPNLVYGECIDIKYGVLTVDLQAERRYAVAVFHDKNRNGTLDTLGPFKIPKEGIGFSNNPKILKSRPKWKEVSFKLTEINNNQVIKLFYIL